MHHVGLPYSAPMIEPTVRRLLRIRDNIEIPTLTAWGYQAWDMTVGWCVGHCISEGLIYAGLENGVDCCKSTPTASPEGRFSSAPIRCFDLIL